MSGTVPNISGIDTDPEIARKVHALNDEAKSKVARVFAKKILSQLLATQINKPS